MGYVKKEVGALSLKLLNKPGGDHMSVDLRPFACLVMCLQILGGCVGFLRHGKKPSCVRMRLDYELKIQTPF
jgi:hypothetical protein